MRYVIITREPVKLYKILKFEGLAENGGAAKAAIEQLDDTIVALRDGGWQLLRPGPIPESAVAALLGDAMPAAPGPIDAPGQLQQHYSPGKPVRLDADSAGEGEFLIGFGGVRGDCSLSGTGDLTEAAARAA